MQCFFLFYHLFKGLIVSVRIKNARKLKVFESEIWGIFRNSVCVISKEFSQSAFSFLTLNQQEINRSSQKASIDY